MCGISGFADFLHTTAPDVLDRMTAALAHRGPDGQGTFVKDCRHAQVGLGHRRLSIIDLSAAADQPMHLDELSVVFNGEIYNYVEIRQELIALGHHFKTHSDTEVILHAWREWGESAVHKWRGMFAIVLLDSARGELICIRDRAGVKPFHYYHRDGLFLFASELKSLHEHPRFERTIEPAAVASFLQYGYVSAPHSVFRHTHKLEPGHILRLDLETRSTSITRYWSVYDAYNRPKLTIDLNDATVETERVLREAFEYRMVADVPVGIFLSGGYDSTCVAALLQQGRTERLRTFTIGSPDSGLDEAPFAKAIAAHLGTDHTEYYCTAQDALDIVPSLPTYYDEPFADSSAIPTILVSRMARERVTVALSADAGDEVFAGYNRYDYIGRYGQKLRAIPAPMRMLAATLMSKIPSDRVPIARDHATFHSRYEKLQNLLRDPSTSQLLKNLSRAFSDDEIATLMQRPVTLPHTPHDRSELREPEADPLAFMMAMDYRTYLVDDILQKVDRATMSTSLEGREPFLDQHIIEWAARLPSAFKYRNGTKKFLLREIVHRYVPKAMMDRPKMGFGIPIHAWLKRELKPLVLHHLGRTALAAHDLFDADAVERLVARFYAGRTEYHLKVWYLLMFQMWHAHWIENRLSSA